MIKINHSGYLCWHDEDGQVHRDGDLPALIGKSGIYGWYQHGKLHRDGGKPAYINGDFEEYWINDKRIR